MKFVPSHMCTLACPCRSHTRLNFYVGKNTPERRDYIMTNLVVPVED